MGLVNGLTVTCPPMWLLPSNGYRIPPYTALLSSINCFLVLDKIICQSFAAQRKIDCESCCWWLYRYSSRRLEHNRTLWFLMPYYITKRKKEKEKKMLTVYFLSGGFINFGYGLFNKNQLKRISREFRPSVLKKINQHHPHRWLVLGPHLRTPNPGFNPGFTPRICYIKGGTPRVNPGFVVLRFGLCTLHYG
jgi:hypothetical protein